MRGRNKQPFYPQPLGCKAQLDLQEGKKKTATAPELEFGDIKTANKKVKHIAIDSRFCDVCQQVTVEDMIKCMPCRKWVHENFTEVKKRGEKRSFLLMCVIVVV